MNNNKDGFNMKEFIAEIYLKRTKEQLNWDRVLLGGCVIMFGAGICSLYHFYPIVKAANENNEIIRVSYMNYYSWCKLSFAATFSGAVFIYKYISKIKEDKNKIKKYLEELKQITSDNQEEVETPKEKVFTRKIKQ